MQVHELKAFLNETSRRNLTDDDMTSICLEPASAAKATVACSKQSEAK